MQRVRALLRRFDLVWPLERFADGVRALARTLGLPEAVTDAALAVQPVAPVYHATSGRPRDHLREEARVCGGGGCGDIVAERAPFDAQLHAWVGGCFQEGEWRCRLS